MSEWKRDNVRRQQVQRGIVELRPSGHKNTTPRQCDWLIVTLSRRYSRSKRKLSEHAYLSVLGEYRTEEIAVKARPTYTLFRERCYVCHRSVYNLMKPLWRD